MQRSKYRPVSTFKGRGTVEAFTDPKTGQAFVVHMWSKEQQNLTVLCLDPKNCLLMEYHWIGKPRKDPKPVFYIVANHFDPRSRILLDSHQFCEDWNLALFKYEKDNSRKLIRYQNETLIGHLDFRGYEKADLFEAPVGSNARLQENVRLADQVIKFVLSDSSSKLSGRLKRALARRIKKHPEDSHSTPRGTVLRIHAGFNPATLSSSRRERR